MRAYLRLLGSGDFGRVWCGASVSLLGDGMTLLALSWLVLNQGGTAQLSLLGVCFTAPVVLGGLAVGPLLDRFDKRVVLIVDSVFRAVCVASVPLAAALGHVPTALPFVVAGVYGLLKMVPMAGFPASIPQLVEESDLDTANALESLSFSVSSVVGPALAGVLVGTMGAPNVLLIDAVTYLVFAGAVATVRRPLAAAGRPAVAPRDGRGAKASVRTVGRDKVIAATTLAFMAFNIADGMLLLVVGPWLAKNELGGASALGALIASLAAGEFVGAVLAGGRAGGGSVRRIGLCQAGAALGFLAVLGAPQPVLVGAGYFCVGLLSAPMTVWAQSLRMRRIPPEMHGRAFAALRTLMQGTSPVGSAIAAPVLVHGGLGWTAAVMVALAGLPGLWLLRYSGQEEAPLTPAAAVPEEQTEVG
ncbi:MFS transporter [Streptomyces sp. NPDC046805]|uniref:MFS transporter n=1 Tax=Streptomyces sp. NPDC046805 TaxID=3155134 RepID=UPI003405C79A